MQFKHLQNAKKFSKIKVVKGSINMNVYDDYISYLKEKEYEKKNK